MRMGSSLALLNFAGSFPFQQVIGREARNHLSRVGCPGHAGLLEE
jgi:hypothetical protein